MLNFLVENTDICDGVYLMLRLGISVRTCDSLGGGIEQVRLIYSPNLSGASMWHPN
ncbi:hypothetical protein [Leptothoe spongobia]|uniref:Uncharacterized protein n=1 Tax=Leptothoe spongobia TAU-MAC 1115 TaxID=1967444 RepID=A0A947DD44_9CYAN|nr:hypothetical protein [Leptothoe spongobia]MBT9314762.1 hypothetical protein [Leptothoe spongobia TAU-MAC 1115]